MALDHMAARNKFQEGTHSCVLVMTLLAPVMLQLSFDCYYKCYLCSRHTDALFPFLENMFVPLAEPEVSDSDSEVTELSWASRYFSKCSPPPTPSPICLVGPVSL